MTTSPSTQADPLDELLRLARRHDPADDLEALALAWIMKILSADDTAAEVSARAPGVGHPATN